jgi:formylmethanofuran dehydrogenase subunit B
VQFNTDSMSFSPRRMNLQSLLEHRETDLVVLIGEHNRFPRKTLSFLKELKVIQISPLPTQSINPVWFPVGQIGVSIAGTMSRLDGLPVFIAPIRSSDHKTVKDWINTLSSQVAG